ncbi:hypothetical protein QEG73_10370 [Chitinophagaceae bacterium 26-R-25]|nr:hypothetical protein [Chitinophagaceae bacterium 26-R-25]
MSKKNLTTEKSAKKTLRTQIENKLFSAFEELKSKVGEKKFSRHVKKASKILAAGTKDAKPKKVKKAAKPTKTAKAEKAAEHVS